MTGSKTKYRNGLEYKFEDISDLFGENTPKPRKNVEYETQCLRALRENKTKLLKEIEACRICPERYRRKIYKQLHYIDISKKEAGAKLEDMGKEIAMVAFNLLLNPVWVRGLLKLTDEIIDQTLPDDRKRLSQALDSLNSRLGLLKKECNIFQLEL